MNNASKWLKLNGSSRKIDEKCDAWDAARTSQTVEICKDNGWSSTSSSSWLCVLMFSAFYSCNHACILSSISVASSFLFSARFPDRCGFDCTQHAMREAMDKILNKREFILSIFHLENRQWRTRGRKRIFRGRNYIKFAMCMNGWCFWKLFNNNAFALSIHNRSEWIEIAARLSVVQVTEDGDEKKDGIFCVFVKSETQTECLKFSWALRQCVVCRRNEIAVKFTVTERARTERVVHSVCVPLPAEQLQKCQAKKTKVNLHNTKWK